MKSEELASALVKELRPVRRLRSVGSRAVRWAVLAVVSVAVCSLALGERADLLQKLGEPAFLVENASLLLLFALAARSAFLLSVPGGERGAITRILPILALLLSVLLVALRWSPATADSPALLSGAWWRCPLRMVCLTLVPTLAAFTMLGRAAPLRRGWTGLLAALAAGALAILGTRLVCPNDDALHVLVRHLGPLLVAALIGLGAGRLLLSPPHGSAP